MKKNRQVISQIAIILIFMVGILTMLYPFYVDALNNVIDQVRVDRYLKESQKEFEAERKRLAEENNKLSDSGLAPVPIRLRIRMVVRFQLLITKSI